MTLLQRRQLSLRKLILSGNHLLGGELLQVSWPGWLAALYVSGTNVSGALPPYWPMFVSSELRCVVAYNCPSLCGPLHHTMPCSLRNFTHGSGLGTLALTWQ
jgi:hypothetical protein